MSLFATNGHMFVVSIVWQDVDISYLPRTVNWHNENKNCFGCFYKHTCLIFGHV